MILGFDNGRGSNVLTGTSVCLRQNGAKVQKENLYFMVFSVTAAAAIVTG